MTWSRYSTTVESPSSPTPNTLLQVKFFLGLSHPQNILLAEVLMGSGRSLEEGTATHSSILAWRTPWTEEPCGLQSMGSHRVDTEKIEHEFTSTDLGNNSS